MKCPAIFTNGVLSGELRNPAGANFAINTEKGFLRATSWFAQHFIPYEVEIKSSCVIGGSEIDMK